MSQVSDSLTGGTGTTDTSGLDTSGLNTSDMFSNLPNDTFDTTTGDNFTSFNDIANAFSGGGAGASPAAAQSVAMTPPSAAASSGGDPTGAASGTQSSTAPGQTPQQQQGQGPNQQQSKDNQYAPPEAVDQLKQLIKRLQGKPQGPTGLMQAASQIQQPAPFALPTMAAGQTGPQSPGSFAGTPVQPAQGGGDGAGAVAGAQPAGASLPPNAAAAPDPSIQPPAAATPTAPAGQGGVGSDAAATARNYPTPAGQVAAEGGPASAQPIAGPSTTGGQPTPKTDDQGRDITVKPKAAGAGPARVTTPPGTADKSVPTKKDQPAAPPPAQQPPTDAHSNIPPPRLLRDIAGISTGNPTALLDLARAAGMLAPVLGMMMGGGRRGRFGGFRGGRFTRGIGGFHPGGGRAWPYHHAGMGWSMHNFHPGGGWRPMHPRHAAEFGYFPMGGGMGGAPQQDPNAPNQQDPNALDPNRPPKETGADPGPAGDTASGAIPGVSAKDVDAYTRQVAQKYNIDPDVASKVLAQESSYGQARTPGDNGTSFGPFQLHFAPDGHAMGDDFRRDTGLDPRDPKTWKQQIDYAMMRAAQGGWGPWTTTMKKLGMNQWTGINRQFGGQPYSKEPPAWAKNPPSWMQAGIPPSLPETSKPSVASQ